MNRFERGKKVKQSIGIGAEKAAIDIHNLTEKVIVNQGDKTFPAHKKLSEIHVIRVLLGVKAGELNIEDYFLLNYVPAKSPYRTRKKYTPLKNFRGKWLRFKNHIYYIPK